MFFFSQKKKKKKEKTGKENKKPKWQKHQGITTTKKEKQNKKHGVHFILVRRWSWDLSWSVVDIPISLHWRKLLSLQVSTAHSLLVRAGTLCPFSSLLWIVLTLNLTWVCVDPMNAVTVAVGSYFRQSCCVWRHFSLVPSTTSGS